jgi:SPP1 family predicted phage head-tail adaptor
MGYSSGKLRQWIDIESKTISRDSDGELVESWMFYRRVPASIEPLSVREFITANTLKSKVTTRITIRSIDSINATMRIMHNSIIYNIEGILRDNITGLEYMTLACSHGTNDG